MNRRISETLELRDGKIACKACGHGIAAAGTDWKAKARISQIPIRALPGVSAAAEAKAVVRRFCCPSCGGVLESETALPDDPPLRDVVVV